jgi:hypothetical protein
VSHTPQGKRVPHPSQSHREGWDVRTQPTSAQLQLQLQLHLHLPLQLQLLLPLLSCRCRFVVIPHPERSRTGEESVVAVVIVAVVVAGTGAFLFVIRYRCLFVCHSERSEESRKTHTSNSLPDISTSNLPALVFGITAGL